MGIKSIVSINKRTVKSLLIFNLEGIFYCVLILRLQRISPFDPGFQAAQDGISSGKTVLQKDQRRPGACVFSRSGAIGDYSDIRV
jgi:hypothetical protein